MTDELLWGVLLIVDRLKAHDAAKVHEWLEGRQDRIEVFYLPTRAPERNPDEYLNNDLKSNVHDKGLPEDKEELRSSIQGFMRALTHLPEHVMSYFRHLCVQYAAGL